LLLCSQSKAIPIVSFLFKFTKTWCTCRASGVAAAGAAVAFYFYSRRVKVCGFGGRREETEPENMSSHFEGAYQAPSTWMEALYFFAEALRLVSQTPSTSLCSPLHL
jgi:hypothetical protein